MVVRDYVVRNFKIDDTRVKATGLGKSPDANGNGVEVLVCAAGTAVTHNVQKQGQKRPPAYLAGGGFYWVRFRSFFTIGVEQDLSWLEGDAAPLIAKTF
jgi:hypothetical protein